MSHGPISTTQLVNEYISAKVGDPEDYVRCMDNKYYISSMVSYINKANKLQTLNIKVCPLFQILLT